MTLEIFEHRVVGPLQCNCYIVGDPATREAIVIDPGDDENELAEILATRQLNVTGIVATHAHFDHIVAAGHLREVTGAPFYLHDADVPLLDWMQTSGRIILDVELPPPPDVDVRPTEGDVLQAGGLRLEVLHTPGHSPGSISLVADDAIFAGDTLFAGSVGRTDLPGGDSQQLLRAITHKLFSFEEDLPVYPGHGPATTLGEERRSNPFVGTSGGLWTP
jgi:glyoxylase-like metal-dependent hydrolase (beta-lactamase superfamily II)